MFNVFFAFAAVAIYRAAREAIGLPSQRGFRVELLGGITGQVVTYWILVGFAHAASYYRRAREREIMAAELTAELSAARLDALRMQLHPHFLFNTMHAIEHGIATRLRGGRLELSAAASDGTLILRVSDDGPGIPDADRQPHRAQVGLRNTRARLAHLYGPTGALELKNRDDGGLTATVKLPLRRAQPLHRDGAT